MEPIVITSTSEVRIGDTVRRTETFCDVVETRTLVVAEVEENLVRSKGGVGLSFAGAGALCEVIERPEPLWRNAKPDSLWHDPETDTWWRRALSDPGRTVFVQVGGTTTRNNLLIPDTYRDDQAIADRFVPVEPEGVSPWLWDPETETAWIAGVNFGTGVTHVQVQGRRTQYGYLSTDRPADREITARLIPYAEREQ